MNTLVIYDITEDKIRNKVAEVCKDYGLTRIQWSAFLGELSNNHGGLSKVKTLKDNEGNIQIFPICSKDILLKKKYQMVVKDD